MTTYNREYIADLIVCRIEKNISEYQKIYLGNSKRYFYIDDLLPKSIVHSIYNAFPESRDMIHKSSLRENKYIAAQMDQYDNILEETVFAFQDPRVVGLFEKITGIVGFIPDNHLYAGGISLMSEGCFLNPHLDNSHDKDRELWRGANLLYYVTPDWEQEYGGNLELWDKRPDSMGDKPNEIFSKFNRLAFMVTDHTSWHSVNKVRYPGNRCCISNYYFPKESISTGQKFHVTSFAGRPEQVFRRIYLKVDVKLRMLVRRLILGGVFNKKHRYSK